MKINVVFEAQLREIAGQQELSLLLDGNPTVFQVLQHASVSSPTLRERLLSNEDRVQPGIMIFVNDQPVTSDTAKDQKLQDGDSVLLLPPISGG